MTNITLSTLLNFGDTVRVTLTDDIQKTNSVETTWLVPTPSIVSFTDDNTNINIEVTGIFDSMTTTRNAVLVFKDITGTVVDTRIIAIDTPTNFTTASVGAYETLEVYCQDEIGPVNGVANPLSQTNPNATYVAPTLAVRYWEDFDALNISFEASTSFSPSTTQRRISLSLIDTTSGGSYINDISPYTATSNVVYTTNITITGDQTNELVGPFTIPDNAPNRTYYDRVEIYAFDENGQSETIVHESGMIRMLGPNAGDEFDYTQASLPVQNTGTSVTGPYIQSEYTRNGSSLSDVIQMAGGDFEYETTGGPNNDGHWKNRIFIRNQGTAAHQRSEFSFRDNGWSGSTTIDKFGFRAAIQEDGSSSTADQNIHANKLLMNNGYSKLQRRNQGTWHFFYVRDPNPIMSYSNTLFYQWGKGRGGSAPPTHSLYYGHRTGNEKAATTNYDMTQYLITNRPMALTLNTINQGPLGNESYVGTNWDVEDSGGSPVSYNSNGPVLQGNSGQFHDLGRPADFTLNTWIPVLMYSKLAPVNGILRIWVNWTQILDFRGPTLYDDNHLHARAKLSWYDAQFSSWDGQSVLNGNVNAADENTTDNLVSSDGFNGKGIDYSKWYICYDNTEEMYDVAYFQAKAALVN